MLLQYVSLKETQYPKASTLLCALPFPRKDIVLAKYIFCITIYFACCLILELKHFYFHNFGI
ncbi:MAG: ABC-2 transporter permease [Clostridia bacterium]